MLCCELCSLISLSILLLKLLMLQMKKAIYKIMLIFALLYLVFSTASVLDKEAQQAIILRLVLSVKCEVFLVYRWHLFPYEVFCSWFHFETSIFSLNLVLMCRKIPDGILLFPYSPRFCWLIKKVEIIDIPNPARWLGTNQENQQRELN